MWQARWNQCGVSGGPGTKEFSAEGTEAAKGGRRKAAGGRAGRGGAGRERGGTRDPAMSPGARLALLALLALGGDPAAATGREDTFSALTSVARALAPERRLLGTLRRYLRGEEARLRDLTR